MWVSLLVAGACFYYFLWCDPIDRLDFELSCSATGLSGLWPLVPLPADATPQEVVAKVVDRNQVGKNVPDYRLLKLRKFGLIGRDCQAALVGTPSGEKIVLFRRVGDDWAARLYNAW